MQINLDQGQIELIVESLKLSLTMLDEELKEYYENSAEYNEVIEEIEINNELINYLQLSQINE